MSSMDVEAKLKGTTLLVYWHLLKTGSTVSVRRLQRELDLSSPSVALYHLEKLVNLGLVEKNFRGDYELKQTVGVGVLKSFVRVSGFMVPRYLFYTAYFLTLLIVFITQYAYPLSFQGFFTLLIGFSAAGITAYETVRQWRLKPV